MIKPALLKIMTTSFCQAESVIFLGEPSQTLTPEDKTNIVIGKVISGMDVVENINNSGVVKSSALSCKGLTGTKLVCGEGGCGACTVLVSKLDPLSAKTKHRAMNACLLYYNFRFQHSIMITVGTSCLINCHGCKTVSENIHGLINYDF